MAAAGLDHPNIVPVYEAGEEGPCCFIASAYCPGITLATWLRGRTRVVPHRMAAKLVATLAEAVEHAHNAVFCTETSSQATSCSRCPSIGPRFVKTTTRAT